MGASHRRAYPVGPPVCTDIAQTFDACLSIRRRESVRAAQWASAAGFHLCLSGGGPLLTPRPGCRRVNPTGPVRRPRAGGLVVATVEWARDRPFPAGRECRFLP